MMGKRATNHLLKTPIQVGNEGLPVTPPPKQVPPLHEVSKRDLQSAQVHNNRHPRGGLLTALLTVLCLVPRVSPDKLSVIVPNQNQQYDLDHGLDQPATGVTSGLSLPLSPPVPPAPQFPPANPPFAGVNTGFSPPLGQPLPPVPQFSFASPPAPVPIGPPGSPSSDFDIRNALPGDNNILQDRVPPVSGLYEVPDEVTPEESDPGVCAAQTVTVTSRDLIVSTSVTQIVVPTTIVRRFTTTQVQLQTALQTFYVTLPPYTETQTLPPQTVYITRTQVQRQVITSTQYITSRVTDLAYTTITETNLRYQTVYSTRVEPTYITTTVTQYTTRPLLFPTPAPNTGYDYSAPTAGYNYPAPSDTSSSFEPPGGSGGYYGNPAAPAYGPFFHASYFQSPRRGLFGRLGFGGG
ncbi:BUB3-interacting and GLEBS motif-containing protein ZNF207-like [Eriocheir sinensis]|uniref:BUB3-interacting and GLEBS motif-containing protein ZNF207-like n=1 Tax=Eriocheir sinensis TaxID=95602 RepID=UPI0021C72352|nr:BUB3-interacting and GLEBS motif-containing protein ZNF207-like [Eriocheir sinensis]